MQRRRAAGVQGRTGDNDTAVKDAPAAAAAAAATATADAPAALRRPRHGGWKGTEPGREAQMLRGEPGYHLGVYLYYS